MSREEEFHQKMYNFIRHRCYKENRRWSANEIQVFAGLCVNLAMDYKNPEVDKILENGED